MEKRSIGQTIKFYREQKGYTQTMLAYLSGYTNSSTIAKIEKGLVVPGMIKAANIANALQIPLEALTGKPVNDDKIILEAYKSAPIDKKLVIKTMLNIPLTEEEINEAIKNNFSV